MRIILCVLAFGFSFTMQAKEWKTLKHYQKFTQKEQLSPSDWLNSDRKKNTLVWQKANDYNLNNNKPNEYQTISQRRDFYIWIDQEFEKIGHEVIWQKMALYISQKLRLLETFPHVMFISKSVKEYVHQGSEMIFNYAFERLKELFYSKEILKNNDAIQWDKDMMHDEQYIWVESIYKKIDKKSLKQVERMASGKFLYALVVPKTIRFKDDISSPEDRYQYAINVFRPYCINYFK